MGKAEKFLACAVLYLGSIILVGCSDAIDNALEINGSRLMNVPLRLEGAWEGQLSPNGGIWVRCLGLHPEFFAEEMTRPFSVAVQGEALDGRLEAPDGQLLEISGTAAAGSWHTGINHATAGITLANAKRIGRLEVLPYGTTGHAWVDGSFEWSAYERGCRLEGVLVRGSQGAPQQTASN